MGFGDAVKLGFSNYANFSGGACRSEFWYWFLFVIILNIPFCHAKMTVVAYSVGGETLL